MSPYLRLLFLLSSVLLVVRSIDAQSVFSLQRAQSSLISAPLKGDAAFFYETTHQIKDQMGEWNFMLKERERASVNILNEEGNYQEVVLFTDGDDVFSFLKFSYEDNGQLQQVEEKTKSSASFFSSATILTKGAEQVPLVAPSMANRIPRWPLQPKGVLNSLKSLSSIAIIYKSSPNTLTAFPNNEKCTTSATP